MRPKFKYSDLNTLSVKHNGATKPRLAGIPEENWITSEKIPVKSVYTKEDLEGMEHLEYAAGLPPFFTGLIRECTL